MNRTNWAVIAVSATLVLLVFLIGVSLMGGWGLRGWGWMGPGMMGPGMMGGWGHGMFGWIGMIFMWVIPLGLVVLLVLGIIWLVRAIGAGGSTNTPARSCPNCGRTAQADWKSCPYCGQALP